MEFELVTTDGSDKPNRIVDEAEAKRLLLEQYGHDEFLEGLKADRVASVHGGILRRVPHNAELKGRPLAGGPV